MSKTTVTGCYISATASLPPQEDQAGYEGLTYTPWDACQIKTIVTAPDTWETQEDDTLCPTGAAAEKTNLVFGAITVTANFDKTDAIYPILKTAMASTSDKITIVLTHPDGVDKVYYVGQVQEFSRTYGGKSDFIGRTLIFQPTSPELEVFA